MESIDLAGIGIGPFNLSLAALLDKVPKMKSRFFDKKQQFDWHPELMFQDSVMQTSYLKDLVTPVDPTSPHSFLNYLCQTGKFYAFMNTRRSVIFRREFEQYCQWVSQNLKGRLEFGTEVREIKFNEDAFEIFTDKNKFKSRNICVATGMVPRIPECAEVFMGDDNLFFAKSSQLKNKNLSGKSVLILGGGQTGIEIFRNILMEKWGRPSHLRLLTRRRNLEPLDESAFTNEYFTPSYVDQFWNLEAEKKVSLVNSQKLASDGNTPSYLTDLYNDLYRLRFVEEDPRPVEILACRELLNIEKSQNQYQVVFKNNFQGFQETYPADIVIVCTGFQSKIPNVLEPLFPKIQWDPQGRFQMNKSYSVEWDGPRENRIYALNYSRYQHGIVDPQTSLMAWRSAKIVNDLASQNIYELKSENSFINYALDSLKGELET